MKTLWNRDARESVVWLSFAFIVSALGVFLAIVQPGGSGLLASIELPDGSAYLVGQRCNWSSEPYTVSFNMRSPEGEWGWCYLDHQANRWRDVSLTYDVVTDVVTVSESGVWKAALDRKRSVFAIGDGRPRREVDAPQIQLKRPQFVSR